MRNRKIFHLILIKPSHYDDDGYVIQFWRSAMPSNSLAVLHGLADECGRRKIFGQDVELRLTAIDETNTRVRVKRLVGLIRKDGGRGMIGLVGVQSNQYPRSLDLARSFRAHGLPVVIGGFHVSGCLAMFDSPTPELQEAMDMGVTLFAGEAEGRLDELLRDAYADRLKPLYDYSNQLPDITSAPLPILPAKTVLRNSGGQSSFDAGRGCPFTCSFCTIINVQGRKSRSRSPEDIASIVRENVRQGIKRFFITDDNFARNSSWEPIFDSLIALRRQEGLKFNLALQVDTLCHRIDGFIEKAARAGVKRVFIGLENIRPENLIHASKRQNHITEYRKMLQAWRQRHVFIIAGYILGFPNDTPESIAYDLEIIKRELPIDILEFFFLTPLPGSRDHQQMVAEGRWMEPDLNIFDLNHVTAHHPVMDAEAWRKAYRAAWDAFYSEEHIVTVMKRANAAPMSLGKVLGAMVWFYQSILKEGVHPLESGFLRRKVRTDRRPGRAIENPLVFYPRFLGNLAAKTWSAARMFLKYHRIRRAMLRDPEARNYTDQAIEPVNDEELSRLDMYTVTEGARKAVERDQKRLAQATP